MNKKQKFFTGLGIVQILILIGMAFFFGFKGNDLLSSMTGLTIFIVLCVGIDILAWKKIEFKEDKKEGK
jgi:hypothetical protein